MKLNSKFLIVFSIIIYMSIAVYVQSKGNATENVSDQVNKRFKDAIVLYEGSPISFVNNERVPIDKEDGEIYPIIQNDRTLVPVRFISESLGAQVEWDYKTDTATLTLKDNKIKLVLNSDIMFVNGKKIKLDVKPVIKNERMFIPLRAISEAYEKQVYWDNGLIVISDIENIIDAENDKEIVDEIVSKVNVLPSVNSLANLKNLLEKSQNNNINGVEYSRMDMDLALNNDMAFESTSTQKVMASNENNAKAKSDYSKTNIQVEGVDEADIVKTDGQYIYHVNRNKVNVFEAYPAETMKLVSSLDFSGKSFSPNEIYIDGNKLVVIGNSYESRYNIKEDVDIQLSAVMPQSYPYYHQNAVKAYIFDTTDKSNLVQKREIEVDGYYVSSRKIGESVYLVTNQNIGYHILRTDEIDIKNITPAYKDTAVNEEFVNVDYCDIQYLPNFIEPNYLIIAGFNVNDNEKVNISTYLGAGNNIYSSTENLYVAVENYKYEKSRLDFNSPSFIAPIYSTNTLIYKFGLDNGKVNYKSKGEVPGTILNQFSMDESNDYFRIATTTGEIWRNDENTSKNNVYVLDNNMYLKGKLEDLAPGERIYSVRFMGDRAYVVTFKTVDPLFVIDLKDPTAPKVLGELKIPGFSNYLHPYDENHIIGFGNDTMEIPTKDRNGIIINTRAITTGMKIAIFDVSDVSNPIQKHSEKIGGMGTYSELLNNHKALLFSKDKNLLAFPISVNEDRFGQDGIPQYGETIFKGAYVYNIDLENGFDLKGKITHYENVNPNERYYFGYENQIQRIMYIDDVLYTISHGKLKSNDLNTLKVISEINVK